MGQPFNVSGFIEFDNRPIPPEDIEPLEKFNGSTCLCFMLQNHGKRLLMKRLRPEYATNPRYIEIFFKEYETGSKLSNPHLVKYVSLGKDADGPYIIMEFVDGVSLSDKIQNNPDYFADPKHISRFFSQLLSVLGCLHNHQVLHLDLKPDNILLTRISDNVKLIDLGFCYSDSYYNSMGCNKGYAAPEQLNGEIDKINVSTDLYAVGRLLHDITTLNKKLSRNSALQEIIAKSTAKDPAARYTSAQDMADDITAALAPPKFRHVMWAVINVLGLAIILGAILDWRYSRHQSATLMAADSLTVFSQVLVAYYPFDGNIIDESGFDNDGTFSIAPPRFTTDRHGNVNRALDFGGAQNPNWVVVPQSTALSFNNALTLSAWVYLYDVKPDGPKDSDILTLVSKGGKGNTTSPCLFCAVNIHNRAQDNISILCGQQSSKGGPYYTLEYPDPSLKTNTWWYFAFTIDSHTVNLYINGELKYSQYIQEVDFSAANSQDLYIGNMSSNLEHDSETDSLLLPFFGKIDDIRIYNYALSNNDIKHLFSLK